MNYYSQNLLVSLFIRAPDLGFLKLLYRKSRFFVFEPARKIRDTNQNLLCHNLFFSAFFCILVQVIRLQTFDHYHQLLNLELLIFLLINNLVCCISLNSKKISS